MLDARGASRAWLSFRDAGGGALAFTAARLAVAPLGPLDSELRALDGRVLSLGCGFGIVERYVAEINPGVEVVGVELDRGRVDAAARTSSSQPRVEVRAGDASTDPAGGPFDAALAIDLLHHLPYDKHAVVAGVLARALRPGATCLVKDIAKTPRWKYRWNALHDRLAAGESEVKCREPEEMEELFVAAGFDSEGTRRLSPLSPYPHYLVRLRRR